MQYSGGGLYVAGGGVANLDGCRVYENEATQSGGGLYVSNDGVANLTECQVFKNTAYEVLAY